MTTTIVLILVALNVVLLILGLTAWRLFRSDPNPTVSDPLGVSRVARVSGIVGTVSDGSGTGQPGAAKSLVATTATQAAAETPRQVVFAPGASESVTVETARGISTSSTTQGSTVVSVADDSDLILPGLFAIDTGDPNPPTTTVSADASAPAG